MNDRPQQDPDLDLNKSIESPDSADRSTPINKVLPNNKKRRNLRIWLRYLEVGIGTIATGIVGMTIHHLMNPPQTNIIYAQQLDRYLDAHWHSILPNSIQTDEESISDLEVYLWQSEEDLEDI
jgi:hypothetical protein